MFVPILTSLFARCSVNGQVFSSYFSYTDRGNIVKALFVLDDSSLHPYFGIVCFYFEVNFLLQLGSERCPRMLEFAYVSWFKFRTPELDRVSTLYMVNLQLRCFYQSTAVLNTLYLTFSYKTKLLLFCM